MREADRVAAPKLICSRKTGTRSELPKNLGTSCPGHIVLVRSSDLCYYSAIPSEVSLRPRIYFRLAPTPSSLLMVFVTIGNIHNLLAPVGLCRCKSWIGVTVVRQAIRFIYDSAVLITSEQTVRQKLSTWQGFLRLSLGLPRKGIPANLAGFHVSYFDQYTLSFLFREIFVRQVYRLKMSDPEPLILDCGANLGMATLFFKFLYPECQVRCFEPDPTTFQLLQKNVADNRLQSVEAFNVALWSENSSVDFFCDPVAHGSLLMSTSAARVSCPAVKVPARRLSEFIDRPVDYLKLDVEGAELRVLQELSNSGKLQSVQQMAIEYHHRLPGQPSALSVFLRVLEDNGFEYQIVAGGFPDPSAPRFQDVMIYALNSRVEKRSG